MTDKCPLILTSADSKFAMPCAVMLRSVADNLTWTNEVRAVILDCGLTRSDRNMIAASLRGAPLSIEYRALRRELLAGLRVDRHVSAATYARLLAVEEFREHNTRCIYLDSDMIVLRDIGELWALDLKGHVLGAVQDPLAGLAGAREGLAHRDYWEIDPACRCFNAGLLVIDVDAWCSREVGRRALEIVRSRPDKIRWWDQDALNILMRGDFLEIDPAWNVQPHAFMRPLADVAVWAPETIARCIASPRAIHYAGPVKPWSQSGLVWGGDRFMTYLYRTAWRRRVPNAPWAAPHVPLRKRLVRLRGRVGSWFASRDG